ncbi:Mediator of RNA polymerase II transcription subunit 6 [Malassezia psittaci]|uniref:Mediator of RNA polymerase II transcription subunit 6 n=1 Tax=Malassezia psittaci TaxID=1821823 RepID=A0AAF0F7P4_9BASI|nr:Mediator of RNA polymerase II transcription subunit 6 [Malassezia psittaci]
MAATETPAFNPLHVQWKNPEMLAYLGARKGGVPIGASILDAANVMEYFSTSPFYDRNSNNEHVRMQSAILINQALQNSAQSAPEILKGIARRHQEELKRFTGLEFVLVHSRPPCFIIHKRHRYAPDRVSPPIASYYIINDCIYQAPDMYTILATRLQSSILGLKGTLDLQREHRAAFNPRRGNFGRFLTVDSPQNSSDAMNETP